MPAALAQGPPEGKVEQGTEEPQADSILQKYTVWYLEENGSKRMAVYDTSFSLEHQHYRINDVSPFSAYTGNYGTPVSIQEYFSRDQNPDHYIFKQYLPYLHTPENRLFFNTRIPFAELFYTSAGSRVEADQTFNLLYTQNVNKEWNFGIDFDVLNSRGQYLYQATDHKMLSLMTNRQSEKHQMYAHFGYNKLRHQENGGITLPEQLQTEDTRDVAVALTALNNAVNERKRTFLHIVNRLALGKEFETTGTLEQQIAADTLRSDSIKTAQVNETTVSGAGKRLSGVFTHSLLYDKQARSYTDEAPLADYYKDVFIDSTMTFDSIYFRRLQNTVRFDFQTDPERSFTFGGGVGLRHQMDRYWYPLPTYDTLIADTLREPERNLMLLAEINNRIGNGFSMEAKGKLYLLGYRRGDFDVQASFHKDLRMERGNSHLILDGRVRLTEPSRWMQSYGSNHFAWENNIDKQFSVQGGLSWEYPQRMTHFRADVALLSKMAYFDSLALPAQTNQEIFVWSGKLCKRFNFWYFGFENEVLLQGSSQPEILALPLLSLRHSTFFEYKIHFDLTDGDLYTQLGFDLRYHTPYYADAYMPATGRFYRQQQEKTGNYPFVNVFLNLKVKRTRIFLAFEHVNSGLTGYNYYAIPSYPMPVRVLKYGVAWTFYD